MLPLEEALQLVLAAVPPPVSELIPLSGEAGGRVLFGTLQSPLDLPLFDNSAMDGYAVQAADVRTASLEHPVPLRLAGRVAAGEPALCRVESGACVRLFTGSMLPPGADAVVMQEDTQLDPAAPGLVRVTDAVKPWENVRFRGEDVKRGETILPAGTRLAAPQLGMLASLGLVEVPVARQPVAGLLATGCELREPGGPLAAGQIYESNRLCLATFSRKAGASVKTFPLVPDTLAATRTALERAFDSCDLVISTGGVSVGELDFVKEAFVALGGKLEIWRVAIKPGKPFVFGRWNNKLLFGLPGNPVSAFVTFLLLVRPALLQWQGAAEIHLPSHPAVLAEPLSNRGDRRHFFRAIVDRDGHVRSAGTQASHRIGSLARANALVDVPPETSLPAGTTVSVLRWD